MTQLIASVGTICGLISHISSNIPEYAQLRASGASRRAVHRCARREGALCIVISLVIAAFWILFFFFLFTGVFNPMSSARAIRFDGIGRPLAAIGAFALLYIAAVSAAVAVACRRVDRLDLLQELKELAYS